MNQCPNCREEWTAHHSCAYGQSLSNLPSNPYCEKHEFPAGMGYGCPDCKELADVQAKLDSALLQISEERRKYLEIEREYVLPLFGLATELGFDLSQAVRDNPGKNCNELFIAKIQGMIRLNGELVEALKQVDEILVPLLAYQDARDKAAFMVPFSEVHSPREIIALALKGCTEKRKGEADGT